LGWSPFQIYIFTPSSLDTLGSGALLAYFVTYRAQNVVLLRRIALGVAIAIVVGAALLKIPFGYSGFVSLPIGLLALWLVSKTAEGIPGPIGRLLSFPPIIYIGRISYGIYVYHFFVPIVLQPLFHRFEIKDGGVLFVVICFLATIAVSSLSWFLLENPINSLKNKFTGSSRPQKINHEVSPAAE
jgi:peptidoglycan/LPS O-acetylase OafA/YrhL